MILWWGAHMVARKYEYRNYQNFYVMEIRHYRYFGTSASAAGLAPGRQVPVKIPRKITLEDI